MKLLVTRPIADAKLLADDMRCLGVQSIICPLIEIEPVEFTIADPKAYQAVLVTSSNSVKQLVSSSYIKELKSTPLYAVGDASSKEAKLSGFTKVSSADGDLNALVALAKDKIDPEKGPVLYLSGEVISGDLKALLETGGYRVERVVLYRAKKTPQLSQVILDEFASGTIEGCVLYSKRSAQILCELLLRHHIKLVSEFSFYCLSDAVRQKAVECLSGHDIYKNIIFKTSEKPTNDKMLELIAENTV